MKCPHCGEEIGPDAVKEAYAPIRREKWKQSELQRRAACMDYRICIHSEAGAEEPAEVRYSASLQGAKMVAGRRLKRGAAEVIIYHRNNSRSKFKPVLTLNGY